jgi:hypothetical protein
MPIKVLNLKSIRLDGNTQARVSINNDLVAEYAASMLEGIQFPDIEVYFDGVDYWLVDGFHRYHAMASIDKASASVMVYTGTLRDAVLHSLGVNKGHGLRKSNDDKRKSVQRMLDDPEWSQRFDREIAKHCGCSHTLVGNMRNPKLPDVNTPTAGVGGNIATPYTELDSPNQPAKSNSAPEKPALTANQIEAQQNAANAHGDSDPIAMLEEAEAQINTLRVEIEALQADDQAAQTLKYKRIADIATRRQNELMETVNEREKELQRQANWLRRIGKAVGEDDNSKLAAKVEALARSVKV